MLALATRRLIVAIPTLLAVITAAFFLMHAAPGGPFTRERQVSPEIEARLLEQFHLNEPVWQQLLRYLGGLLRGDLGPSMHNIEKSVWDIIAEGFPTSATLGIAAIIFAVLIGGSLGVLAALRQNKVQDYTVMTVAILGVCLPSLVMGPLLQLSMGLQLQWLPSVGLARDELSVPHLLLPVLALSLPFIAIISRLMRASMIEALRSDAIRTARAKGLPERLVIWRHALPVAALPVLSYLGPALAGIMAGSFVVETVFQLPGIGRQFVMGAAVRDYTLVLGVVIVYSSLLLLLNLIVDLLYGVLDPRARLS